jgi:plastocyanin
MSGIKVGLAIGVFVLFVGGVASTGAVPAVGGASAVRGLAPTGSITVAATSDYGYQPDSFEQVPLAANITVTFTDDDVLQHTFTLSSREGFVIPTSDTPSQLTEFLSTYPPRYSGIVNASGDVSVGNFTSPGTPGWYEFVCNVSGHFQSGMYGFIAFGENLPPNLTRTPRVGLGLGSLTPLDLAGLGAFALALVLGLVLWYRYRMAPPRPGRPPHEPDRPRPR